MTLEILSQPTGAQVLGLTNQVPLGITPWRVEREKDAGPLQLLLRMPGYVEQKMMLVRRRTRRAASP